MRKGRRGNDARANANPNGVPLRLKPSPLADNPNDFSAKPVTGNPGGRPGVGLQIQVFNASTIDEIDTAFTAIAREHPDALFVAPDTFFTSRRVQLATLTARDRIPAFYGVREIVAVGGLMSYGANIADSFINSASIPVASSRALSPPTCRCCKRPNSSLSSIVRPPRRSASPFLRACSPSPTR